MTLANSLMNRLGYSTSNAKSDISKVANPTELGNAVADCYIKYGKNDGSNEA